MVKDGQKWLMLVDGAAQPSPKKAPHHMLHDLFDNLKEGSWTYPSCCCGRINLLLIIFFISYDIIRSLLGSTGGNAIPAAWWEWTGSWSLI